MRLETLSNILKQLVVMLTINSPLINNILVQTESETLFKEKLLVLDVSSNLIIHN